MSATAGATGPTADVEMSHDQHRRMLEGMIGADSKTNHPLWWVLDRVVTSATDERDTLNDREVAALARHFPSLEAAIMIVWEYHVRAGGVQLPSVTPCPVCDADGDEAD